MRTKLFSLAVLLMLPGCGEGSEGTPEQPVSDLTQDAAQGDEAAMAELEKRVSKTVQEMQRNDGEDLELMFQQALHAGDEAAIKKMEESGNPFARTHIAASIAIQSNATDEARTRARALLESAAEAGHGPALFLISEDSLVGGQLYPEDQAKVFLYGIRAAEAGHAEAMYKTGIRYQYGINTAPQNNEEAIIWFEKAKAAGYEDAQRQLDEIAGIE